jgi:DNA-binding transcriptional LysR family regulator
MNALSNRLAEITPDRLHTFLAVARLESFTSAARDVYLSQPAVSRQIAALEKALGVSLFDRLGKRALLTAVGRGLLPEFRRILGDLKLVEETVKGLEVGSRGTLRIGASSTPGLYVIPPILARFQRRFPAVEIDYVVSNTKRVEEMVIENALDVGFVGGSVSDPTLVVERIMQDEVVCFVARMHPLASRSRVTAADVGRETLVMREEGSSTGRLFKSWILAGGGRIGRVIDLGCPEAIKTIVAAGLGVGCLSRLALDDEIARRDLTVLSVGGSRLRRPLSMIRHKRKATFPALSGFITILKGSKASDSSGTVGARRAPFRGRSMRR